jgi:hypothetical protein
MSGWKLVRAAVVIGAGLGLASIATMGWPVHAAFLQQMSGGLGTQSSWVFNSSLFVAAHSVLLDNRWGFDPVTVMRIVATGRLAIVALFAWLWWRLRTLDRSSAGRRHMEFLIALWLGLAISTIVWEHYLALLFPLVAFAAASWERLGRSARAVLLTLLATTVWQNVTFTSLLDSRVDIRGLGLLLTLAALKSAALIAATLLLWRSFAELAHASVARQWNAPGVVTA